MVEEFRRQVHFRFVGEYGVEILGPDPLPADSFAIILFGQVGIGLMERRRFGNGGLKRQVLRGVQGVVSDEHPDRPLRRQQTGEVVGQLVEQVFEQILGHQAAPTGRGQRGAAS